MFDFMSTLIQNPTPRKTKYHLAYTDAAEAVAELLSTEAGKHVLSTKGTDNDGWYDIGIDQWKGGIRTYFEKALIESMSRSQLPRRLRIWQLMSGTSGWDPHAEVHTSFCGPASRNTPFFHYEHLDQSARKFTPGNPFIAVVMISPPDQYGRVSLGPSGGLNERMVRSAVHRVAIMNMRAPRLKSRTVDLGDLGKIEVGCSFDESDFYRIIKVWDPFEDEELEELPPHIVPMAKAHAATIANGSAAQYGIGFPQGLCHPSIMRSRERILPVTEMLGAAQWASYLEAVKRGEFGSGPHETAWAGFFEGSQSLLNSLHEDRDGHLLNVIDVGTLLNPQFSFRLLEQMGRKFYSANGGIEADVDATIESATIGNKIFSGIGGAARTARLAIATGGRAAVVMPSSFVKNGIKRSKITFKLKGTPTYDRWDITDIFTPNGALLHVDRLPRYLRWTGMIGLADEEFRKGLASRIKRVHGYEVSLQQAVDMVAFRF